MISLILCSTSLYGGKVGWVLDEDGKFGENLVDVGVSRCGF